MPPEAEIVSAIGRALTLQQRGQLGGARALLEGVLERAPDHPDALHFLGLVLHQQGEQGPAVERLERAVAVAPQNLDAWNNLGGVVAEADPARAEACFRRVLEAAPAAIATRANLALTLEKLGRLAEARGQVSEILRLTPDDPEALANLARLSRATGDHAASVAAGERLPTRSARARS
ncbi:MAG: tetratricopeptide repeat protein [Polyangiaceae bacterium]|nr:tetratricopeptide repeat protein [Polyangiaceae bacterium]